MSGEIESKTASKVLPGGLGFENSLFCMSELWGKPGIGKRCVPMTNSPHREEREASWKEVVASKGPSSQSRHGTGMEFFQKPPPEISLLLVT